MPTLRVQVVQARDLKGKDGFINKTSDPYIVLRIGTCVAKTFAHNKNLNPVWNQTFDMKFSEPIQGVLSVECFDKNTFNPDESIGYFSIPLKDIDPYNTTDKWYRLNAVKHGDVRLVLTPVDGFSKPAPPTFQQLMPPGFAKPQVGINPGYLQPGLPHPYAPQQTHHNQLPPPIVHQQFTQQVPPPSYQPPYQPAFNPEAQTYPISSPYKNF
ncbi:hypothetical protein AKO1_006110 [Acrasis kona]|uniref:C2 domain-containing protein n=1 Tax=Acrasis kona TaxID=1008807 RepID=A0AAW2YHB8_9EUKA